jgi:hypothetical protein
MEACEVVRLFINKAIVSAEPKRRGVAAEKIFCNLSYFLTALFFG